ncbi:M56 family metallopeptidase, partial [Longimicrobium sp.]|uniref:M56 family metallopeptidase n=1 Tax=Longimicrobium sp. TaxID=2029185 RepID=UPI002E3572EA
MSARVAEAVGWALVHSLWQFALLGAALALALRVLRGAPSTHRYALACATLALMLATSVATGVVAWRGGEGAESAVVESASADAHRAVAEARDADPGGVIAESIDVAPRWFRADDVAEVSTRVRGALDAYLGWIVAAWLVGVALLSLRLAGAWVFVQRLTRMGTSAPPRALADAARRLADALGVRRTVAVLASTLVHVPTVVGWLRPVILVPVSALTGLAPRQLELLVLHELAHIRRHDYLVNLLQTVCETLLFHHPAVWYVGRQIRAEREHCCDELAVGLAGVREYAGALATLEALRQDAPALSVAANGGSLLARVRRLVQPAPRPAPPRLGAAVLALLLALAVAAPAVGRVVEAREPASNLAWTPACPGASAAAGSTLCPDVDNALGTLLAGYAPGASAIVQDVRTGAVLAYAATGDDARGLTEPVLPASVWKLVLSALWWEQGMGDGALPCPATLDVGAGRVMRNSTRPPATLAGPAEMLVHSCNTAAATMALRLRDAMGEQGVLNGVRRMGFGAGDGADGRDTAFWATRSADFRARMSPARGRVGPGDAWDGFAIGMLDVETTPLHVARFLQAVGNDGTMVAPTVDAALAGRDAGHPVMSAATARRLQSAMRDVVRRGTGTAAAEALGDAPWTLGGKTGTSPGGAGETDGWFAGLAFDGAGSARYV